MTSSDDDRGRRPRAVLAAVDRADGGAALGYAVADAVRRGGGLHLVYVPHRRPGSACVVDDPALVAGEGERTGRPTLASAAARARDLLARDGRARSPVVVTTERTDGTCPALVALRTFSRHAAVLVLEHANPRGDVAAPASVTAGLAAVACCPVVGVPAAWRGGDAGPVVVGVEDPERDRAVVGAARHEAERRGVPALEVHVADGPPAAGLLARAEAAGLVVVGRHHRAHVVGAPLGRTSRAVLRHASVPVLVIDPVRGDSVRSRSAQAATSRT